MSIVNNILNMVKLNTTDYNKKLQKMKKTPREIPRVLALVSPLWHLLGKLL